MLLLLCSESPSDLWYVLGIALFVQVEICGTYVLSLLYFLLAPVEHTLSHTVGMGFLITLRKYSGF